MNYFYLLVLIPVVSANIVSHEYNDGYVYADVYTYSYALDRINQRKLPLDNKLYNGQYTGSGVDVYVIDTGMNKNMYYSFICGYNFIDNNTDCQTKAYHGTYVGSIIKSKKFGVAPGTTIINLKVLNDNGVGRTDDVIRALDYLLDNNVTCSVVNLSLGGYKDIPLNQKIDQVVKSGNRVIVSAGNSGVDACDFSPSSARSAITVGSTNIKDRRASFSNRGKCVDIYAPGVDVIGAIGFSEYHMVSGTSVSAPLVSGMTALAMERGKCWSTIKRFKRRKGLKIGFIRK